MIRAYMRGIVRLGGRGRLGVGVEVFRADAIEDEDVDLTESETETIGEAGESVAVMRVYETIGEDFYTGKGITAKSFAKELGKLGRGIKDLNIHINSCGGDCFAAQAIHNIIRDFSCEKRTTYIDGVCASAATVIASAADEVVARNNSVYMVHLPWAMVIGNSTVMRKSADQLDTLTVPIVNVYKDQVRGKIQEKTIRRLMEEETWMTANEALEYGFVDKVKGSIKAIAKVGGGKLLANDVLLDVGKYHYEHVPDYPIAVQAQVDLIDEMITRKEKKNMEELKVIPITKEMLVKDYPELLASIADEARAVERARLSALEEMKTGSPELDELVEKAKAEGKQPSDIAMECFKLAKAQASSSQKVAALQRDGEFSVKAGDAPRVKLEDEKKTKAVSMLSKAFANAAGKKG